MHTPHIINVLMTILALVCPYIPCGDICTGACAAAFNASETVEISESPTCCCHDRHCEDQDQKPVQQKCPQDSQLPNCLCGGAVIATMVDCPSLEDAGFHPDFLIVDLNDVDYLSTSLVRLTHTSHRGCHFPPLSSGREICHFSATYLL